MQSVYKEMSIINERSKAGSKEQQLKGDTKLTKKESFVKNAFNDNVLQRSRENSKAKWTFNKEAKEKQQLQDFLLIAGVKGKSSDLNIKDLIVSSYSLSQNYPNPFNPVTTIKFTIPKAGLITIKVYDVLGRMVKELVNEVREAGNHSVLFDGSVFASGIYFYRIETTGFVDTKRMVLVK